MSTVGFLYNFPEGAVSTHPFFLYRVAPMTAYFDEHDIRLFIFSPRHVDPESGRVRGFVRENDRFVEEFRSVPEVIGNWYLGRDKSLVSGGMGGRAFRAWAREHGVALYPNADFTDQLRDKVLTYKLIAAIDPSLHPHTELFENGPDQLGRFLTHSDKVFLKPKLGNKGNQIAVLSNQPNGLSVDYYDQTKKTSALSPDCRRAMEFLRPLMADREYVIQQGISLATHAGAKFILRVIMLSDGQRWHWVHKAVLAAPGSEIANTTQGGSNHPTEAFLRQVYGTERLASLMKEVRRVCFDTIEKLDETYARGLMEVGYDLVIDDRLRPLIVEVNTRPGMTKPGLPMNGAFRDIFNRTPEEDSLYDRFVKPHGTRLAQFLHAKLRAREQAKTHPTSSGATSADSIDGIHASSLTQAIGSAAGYLARACDDDGMFAYRVNLNPAVEVKPRYSVSRHAGAIYSLCAYLDRRDNQRVRATVSRAAAFLRDRYLFTPAQLRSCCGIWSPPGLEVASGRDVVKLGNVALGLVAFVLVDKHEPGYLELEQLRGLGRFLLEAQKADGSFASSYQPARGGFVDRPASLHYPGQAIFALACLYDHDPDPRWLTSASRALALLARSRAGQPTVPADYWALIATSKVLESSRRDSIRMQEPDLLRHAIQVCESILRAHTPASANSGTIDGFSLDGRTAPTSRRLDGLLAALTFLPEDELRLRQQVELAVEHGIEFLLRAQVHDGKYRGGMPRAIRPAPTDAQARHFDRRAGEIRIDYVQHALCAFLRFEHQCTAHTPSSRRCPPDPARARLLVRADRSLVDSDNPGSFV